MDRLTATLRAVGLSLHGARDPWWIIGSAAVRLHGVQTGVADVDVLTSARDAERLCAAWKRRPAPNDGTAHFRSTVFERFHHLPLTVEVMGDLHLPNGQNWSPVRPDGVASRAVAVADVVVFVPDRDALSALLRRFGRTKDMRRAALLDATRPVLA